MMRPLLEVQNLVKVVQDHGQSITLVNDVSFSIMPGELVTITGPSGSGKSSLLYLIGLLDTPTSGDIILHGHSTKNMSQQDLARFRLENLGFIFQFHFLIAEFTSRYNVMIPMLKLGKNSEDYCQERADLLLGDLDLADKTIHLPTQLSGGQRQRVAIARSLANEPSLILADEPTGSLDSKNAKNVIDIFHRLKTDFNKTVIVVTHDLSISEHADRQIIIRDGQVVCHGT